MRPKRAPLIEENQNYLPIQQLDPSAIFFNIKKSTDLESVRRELSARGYRSSDKKELRKLYKSRYYLINAVLVSHETLVSTDPDDVYSDKEFVFVPAIFTQGRSLTFGTVGLVSVNKKLVVYGIKQSDTKYCEN